MDQGAQWISLNNEVFNVKEFGAVGNGTTNDTSAIQAAYDAAKVNGGTILFPPGTYKFNLTIVDSNIRILGSGRGITTFKAYYVDIPVIQVGDGSAAVSMISLQHFTMSPTTPGSLIHDGLVIKGATWVSADDFYISYFERDNIRIETTETRPSYFIRFSNFGSDFAKRGASFKVVGLPSYASAISISDFTIRGYAIAGCKSIWLEDSLVDATNGWVDCWGSELGHVYLKGLGSSLCASNVHIDSPSSTDILVTMEPSSYSATRLKGKGFTVDGKLKRIADGAIIILNGSSTEDLQNRQRDPFILGKIAFNNKDGYDSGTPDESTPTVFLYRSNSGGTHLKLEGAAYRMPLTYQSPVQGSANGALWRDATTGQLRWKGDTLWPASDGAGAPLSQFVAVPASATAAGTPGEWSADANYLYICYASNSWKRVAVSCW